MNQLVFRVMVMARYRRARVAGGTYFFTVVTERRQRVLVLPEVRAALRAAIENVRVARPFDIKGWVLLPDHIHAIWTLPPDDADFATRWRLIKLLFAKGLPKHERLSAVRRQRKERGIWHRRYWEHTIRDERDFEAHVNYIHFNPVKHRHATAPRDWPHSSFNRFVREGLLAPDWAVVPEIELPE